MNSYTYWAAESRDNIAKLMQGKKEQYLKYLENSGILDELRKSYRLYYGNSAIIETEKGKAIMTANHYGSLVRALHTLVTQNRPAFEARAANTDHRTQGATILANGLLDYYLREKRIEDTLKEACILALFLREGWVEGEWDASLGEAVRPDLEAGKMINTGDAKYSVYGILDIIRHPSAKKSPWKIIRNTENKFDLAAKFPDFAEDILKCKETRQQKKRWSLSYLADQDNDNDEDVEVLKLIHDKTPSMPAGRLVLAVGDVAIMDTALPYRRSYLFPITAADAYQTAFGHSPSMDLIPLQDALDTCFSVALSNVNSFGLGCLASEKGSLDVNQIKDGLLHVEFAKGGQAPQILNLMNIPKEIFDFASMLIQNQETISAVNSVARGNVQGDMSGTAMALVAQQALTFSSGLQQSYNSLLENVGTSLIEMLQTFAKEPIVAQIAGKSKRPYMKEFTADDLVGVAKVVVDAANSMAKTTAGKTEIANNLLNSGLIKTPEQYIQVMSTGNLEPLTEREQSQLMLIRSENELLAEGQPTVAILTDLHDLHIREHSCVLNDPIVRQTPQLLQVAIMHIQEHLNLAMTVPPNLAMILGMNPAISAPPPQPVPANMPPPEDLQSAPTPDMPPIAGTDQEFNPQGA